ncbi:hypothetical protein FRC17_010454 [Serendipita sp. 399]|nr:hypothetical protein FRC17_010454 [Serendipita sp. 399]
MVGFDLEWKPMRTPKEYNRVSLVQIATETEVLLLQLSGGGRPHEFPPALKTLLESPSVMKVGAGIDGDVEKLARDWGVHVQNYLDLADMARCVDPFWNTCDILRDFSIDGATGIDWSKVDDDYVGQKQDVPDDLLPVDESLHNVAETHSFLPSPPITPPTPQSLPNDPLDRRGTGTIYPRSRSIALARLVARYQGKRLDKGVQLSNWAAPLSKNQIEYAANDGCAGFDVYNSLARLEQASPEAGRETLPSTVPRLQPAQSFPPVSHHAFHEAASRLNAPQYFSPNSPAQHYHHPISTPYNSPYPHGPYGGMVHQFPGGIWPPENPGFGNQHGWVAPPTFHGPYHHPVDVLPPTAHQPSMWRRASGSLLDNPPIYDHWIGSPYPPPSSSVPNDRWISNFEAVSLKEPPRPTHRTHQSASVTSTTASIGDLFKGPVTPERKRAIRDAITTRHDN